MTLVFHLHASQTLYQSTDATYQQLRDLEAIFPISHFLKTQRALLLYHSKGGHSYPNCLDIADPS